MREGWSSHKSNKIVDFNKTLLSSIAWLKYIVQSYDELPDHAIFLTDAGPDWHTPYDWEIRIKTSAPLCREALGRKLRDGN